MHGANMKIRAEISEGFILEIVWEPLTMYKKLRLKRKEISIYETPKSEGSETQ